jgi:Spy/CpxP family protein refolding chaperone
MIRSAALLFLLSMPAVAQEHGHAPYAGLETREIKSLSGEDLEELQRGGGWGLALPAELNGMPGPAHLLELRDELGLSAEQVGQIETIFAEMKAEAQAAGLRFIEAERALDMAFQEGTLDESRLRALVTAAETARAELRFIHLSRHLSTPPLLTDAQIARYNQLRGYASDPCATVPEGHDAEMWRRHNNCGG